MKLSRSAEKVENNSDKRSDKEGKLEKERKRTKHVIQYEKKTRDKRRTQSIRIKYYIQTSTKLHEQDTNDSNNIKYNKRRNKHIK